MADFGIGEAAAAATIAEAGTSAAALSAVPATVGATSFLTTAGGFLSSALPYLSLASGAISAASSLFGGVQKNDMAGLEATQYEQQASIAKTQAEQQTADRERALASTLATQDAIRSGRGVDLYSPTGLNIQNVSRAAEARDENTINLNGLDAQAQSQLAANLARDRGQGDLLAGVGGAATGLLSSAKALQDITGPKPKNSTS